jgi:hypothetical protein
MEAASVRTTDRPRDDAIAFIAEVIRLQRAVWEISRQVDRLEVEMRQALIELDRERFEEQR